jgi:hypothetical protein
MITVGASAIGLGHKNNHRIVQITISRRMILKLGHYCSGSVILMVE